jgi:hypothetical protein
MLFLGVCATKKTVNISTVRATPETKAKLEKRVKELGFRTIAHFFTRSMETFLEQIDAGRALKWPLRFEEIKKEASVKASSQNPKKSKNPDIKPRPSKSRWTVGSDGG